ncbi:MAG TPA: hypothetical protein VK430_03065 [Xanthobacteraceae bacterium]|nr:hypothetical protein [Xanthobacteraceae bacterium]
MSLHRATLLVFAALFTAGMTSASLACCEWGGPAPLAYTVNGCGGCGASAAVVYGEPVAPPLPPPVLAVRTSGCGCGHPVVYAAPAIEPMPIVPAPIYVVNQGPEYAGPGIMVPYRVWSPAAFAPEQYPYMPGYGSYPYRPRFAYRHPHYYGPHYGRPIPRPLSARD